MSTSEEIYRGFVRFGRLAGTFWAIFSVLLVILLVSGGIKMRYDYSNSQARHRSEQTRGILMNNPKCVVNESGKLWDCSGVKVSYKIGDEVTSKIFEAKNLKYALKSDDHVPVYYDPNDVSNVSLTLDTRKSDSNTLIIVAVALLLLAAIRLYLIRRYGIAAAIEGGYTAASLLI